MSDEMHVESFYKYLISNGYYFDKDLIENYLLSLKVKPFEILTGNSGTGKQNYLSYLLNSSMGISIQKMLKSMMMGLSH